MIYGAGQQSLDFVYVGDVARAILLAATVPAAAGEVSNIVRGQRTTTLLDSLRDLLGRPIEPTVDMAKGLGHYRQAVGV